MLTDEIRIFIFCDHSDIAREHTAKRACRRGRAVFKFKFAQALSVITGIGKELQSSGQT